LVDQLVAFVTKNRPSREAARRERLYEAQRLGGHSAAWFAELDL
jgi:hypothetical protein